MRTLAVISFSLTGCVLAERISEHFKNCGWQVKTAVKSVYLPDSLELPLKEWTRRRFADCEAICFVGACGIAVRSIAPFIKSKKTDPAVLTVDECGQYVVALLSGHLGGANELAKETAQVLGANAVVTTATDLHGKFAVDVFAKKNGCAIFPMTAAKAFSAALLAGEPVGFYSDFPWEGELPEGMVLAREKVPSKNPAIGAAVTVRKDCRPFAQTVYLVPKIVAVGLGCKKGKDMQAIERGVRKAVQQAGIWPQALGRAASICLKAEEEGIQQWCESADLPYETYTREELLTVPGEFTSSEFVRGITGVDSVCERSAAKAGNAGRLIQRKTAEDGVTCALALPDWRIRFE